MRNIVKIGLVCGVSLLASCGQQVAPSAATTLSAQDIQTPTGPNCTRTIGYWKNHPQQLAALLPVQLGKFGGSKSLLVDNVAQATQLLTFKGNASNGIVKLYAQLLASKLGAFGGTDISSIQDTVTQADAFLAQHNAADWSGLSASQQAQVLSWMTTLDRYNNGLVGPSHCQ
ncbi:hypothetical protein [Deinococcus sp.]|uniref:hypothetical protein n=1 Tax=Deinococcus sp. TaxID=47478 RepID=UPI0025C24A01|nr:hypothetical protein [Deinococcus sp.]